MYIVGHIWVPILSGPKFDSDLDISSTDPACKLFLLVGPRRSSSSMHERNIFQWSCGQFWGAVIGIDRVSLDTLVLRVFSTL